MITPNHLAVKGLYHRPRNVIIATYNDSLMGDVQVQPEKGTVAFGSGLHGWGFTTERGDGGSRCGVPLWGPGVGSRCGGWTPRHGVEASVISGD